MKTARSMGLGLVFFALLAVVAALPALAQFEMKVGHQTAEDYQDEVAELFADLTEEYTGGQVEGHVYNAAQLGPGQQQNEQVRLGIQEIVIQPTGLMTNYVPEVGVLDLPFLFRDDAEQTIVLNGDGGDPFRRAAEERGVVILAFLAGGFRDFATSFPFNKIEDLQGRRLRVIESPELIGMAESWNAVGIPIPFPETYTALQTGTVHGLDNAPDTIAALRFHEPAPYYTITRHGSWSTVIVASKMWMDGLPADVRAGVIRAAQQTAQRAMTFRQKWVDWALETVEDDGGTVTELAESERERMREMAVNDVWQRILDDRTKGPILRHLLDALENYRAGR